MFWNIDILAGAPNCVTGDTLFQCSVLRHQIPNPLSRLHDNSYTSRRGLDENGTCWAVYVGPRATFTH